MYEIINIEKSNRKSKRFKATVIHLISGDIEYIHFGLKGGSTYLDHKDKEKRKNYRARHLGNKKEKELIEDLEASPALLSFYLLWGKFTDLKKNIDYLNQLWKEQKHQITGKLYDRNSLTFS